MAHYTFHYANDESDAQQMTCGRLTQAIAGRVHVLFPPTGLPPPHAGFLRPAGDPPRPNERGADGGRGGPPGDSAEEGGGLPWPEGDVAHLQDPDRWEQVSRLQWALCSDLTIRPADFTRLRARLQKDDELEGVRRAAVSLGAALVAAHPSLAEIGRPAVLQLVALGCDMALAAAQSPELLLYVKNELQALDLEALLRA